MVYSGAGGGFAANDAGHRLVKDAAAMFQQQHTAMTAAQNSIDVTNSALLAETVTRSALEHHWQRQELMQLRGELHAIDSRIAHLRILMDLARSVC